MTKKSNLQEVATLANVGIATVDRVLNERGGVSVATSHKVLLAARQLNLNRILPELYRQPLQIEVILSANKTYFFERLNHYFSQNASGMGYQRIVLHRTLISESVPEKLAQHLERCANQRHGVIVFAQDHPAIYRAIKTCHQQGVAVVTLATDLPGAHRLCHVGIDQKQAGGVAGRLMGNMLRSSGEVIMISGRTDYLAHRQRIEGFRNVMVRLKPTILLQNVLVGDDKEEQISQLLQEKLAGSHNVIGIYNTGAGNRVISQVMQQFGLAGKCAYITHELHRTTRQLLQQDILSYTLDQDPQQQVLLSLQLLLNYLESHQIPDLYQSGKVGLSIYMAENCGDAE